VLCDLGIPSAQESDRFWRSRDGKEPRRKRGAFEGQTYIALRLANARLRVAASAQGTTNQGNKAKTVATGTFHGKVHQTTDVGMEN
jgi:hypothetical protein